MALGTESFERTEGSKMAFEKIFLASQARKKYSDFVAALMSNDDSLAWVDILLQGDEWMYEDLYKRKWTYTVLWASVHDNEEKMCRYCAKGYKLRYHPAFNQKMREELIMDMEAQIGIWEREKHEMLSNLGWKMGMERYVKERESTGLRDFIMGITEGE